MAAMSLTLLLLVLTWALPAACGTVYVTFLGQNSPGCGNTIDNACLTVEYGVQQAEDGDTVRIGPGYFPVVNVVVDKSITITSIDQPVLGEGDTLPVLDAKFSGRAFLVTHASVTFQQLGIINGLASVGGGVLAVNSSVQFEGVVMERNVATATCKSIVHECYADPPLAAPPLDELQQWAGGGAIAVFGGSLYMIESQLRNNSAVVGSAMIGMASSAEIHRSSFLDNAAGYGPAVMWNCDGESTSSFVLERALFSGNSLSQSLPDVSASGYPAILTPNLLLMTTLTSAMTVVPTHLIVNSTFLSRAASLGPTGPNALYSQHASVITAGGRLPQAPLFYFGQNSYNFHGPTAIMRAVSFTLRAPPAVPPAAVELLFVSNQLHNNVSGADINFQMPLYATTMLASNNVATSSTGELFAFTLLETCSACGVQLVSNQAIVEGRGAGHAMSFIGTRLSNDSFFLADSNFMQNVLAGLVVEALVEDSNLVISNNTFIDCSTGLKVVLSSGSQHGGLAQVYNKFVGSRSLSNDIFTEEQLGCAEWLIGSSIDANVILSAGPTSNLSLLSQGNEFTGCHSTTCGGALGVLVHNGKNVQVNIEDDSFLSNSVSSCGGGAVSVVMPPDERLFVHKRACPEGTTVCQYQAGVSLCSPTPQLCERMSMFPSWQYTNKLLMRNVSMVGNSATCVGCSGGALTVVNGSVSLDSCFMQGNQASFLGGAIFASGISTAVSLNNSQLLSNTASRASALLVDSRGPLQLRGSTFTSAPRGDDEAVIGLVNAGSAGAVLVDGATSFHCASGTTMAPLQHLYARLQERQTGNLLTWFSVSCEPCNKGTYSLLAGSTRGAWPLPIVNGSVLRPDNPQCLPCPYGASCPGGARLHAKSGFWGYESEQQVRMVLCPEGYCCLATSGHPCTAYSDCTGNRAGRLCGECQAGYTEALGTPACRADDACNDVGFWPLLLFMIAAYIGFLMYRPSALPNPELPVASAGMTKILFYYYQVLPLVLPISSSSSSAATALGALFNYQLHALGTGESGGICPVRGMNAISKIIMEGSMPVVLLAMLIACYYGHRRLLHNSTQLPKFARRLAAASGSVMRSLSATPPDADTLSDEEFRQAIARSRVSSLPLIMPMDEFAVGAVARAAESVDAREETKVDDEDAGGAGASPAGFSVETVGSVEGDDGGAGAVLPSRHSSSSSSSGGGGDGSGGDAKSSGAAGSVKLDAAGQADLCDRRLYSKAVAAGFNFARYSSAAVSLLLLGYASVVEAVMKLLHCEPVDGQLYLFRAAYASCYQWWQVLLFVVLFVIIVPTPLLLLHVRSVAHKKLLSAPPEGMHHWAAALFVMEAPYTAHRKYWESVLLARRLLLIVIYSLVLDPFVRATGLCVCCLFILVWHVWAQPFSHPVAGVLETISLMCLVFISALAVEQGTLNSIGASRPLRELPAIRTFTALLVIAPLLLVVIATMASYVRERWLKRSFARPAAKSVGT